MNTQLKYLVLYNKKRGIVMLPNTNIQLKTADTQYILR